MKATDAAIFLMIVLALALSGWGQTTSDPKHRANPISLKEGDYLRATYVDALTKTRSPAHAEVLGAPELVKAEKNGPDLHFRTIINFHEGGPEFTLNQGGKLTVLLSAGDDVSAPRIAIEDERRFRFGYGQFKPSMYVFVGDAAKYIAGRVLLGKYQDGVGQHYELRNDGWAVFPDHKFKYQIGLDHVLNKYDYIVNESAEGELLAFRWGSEMTLDLFDVTGEIGQSVADKPRYSLHRVASK